MPLKDVEITITIPQSVHDALDALRKQNKVPKQDPNNPEATIFAPMFPSVEAWIEQVVDDNIAPILLQQAPSAAVQQLRDQMTVLETQIRTAAKPTKGVVRR